MADLENEIKQLRKSVAQLRFILVAMCITLGGCFGVSHRPVVVHAQPSPTVIPDVITAKKFVVVNDEGTQLAVIGNGIKTSQIETHQMQIDDDIDHARLIIGKYSSATPSYVGAVDDRFGIMIGAGSAGVGHDLTQVSLGIRTFCIGGIVSGLCGARDPSLGMSSRDMSSFISLNANSGAFSTPTTDGSATIRLDAHGRSQPDVSEIYLYTQNSSASANVVSGYSNASKYYVHPQTSIATGPNQLGLVNCPDKATAQGCPIDPP